MTNGYQPKKSSVIGEPPNRGTSEQQEGLPTAPDGRKFLIISRAAVDWIKENFPSSFFPIEEYKGYIPSYPGEVGLFLGNHVILTQFQGEE